MKSSSQSDRFTAENMDPIANDNTSRSTASPSTKRNPNRDKSEKKLQKKWHNPLKYSAYALAFSLY